MGTVEWEGTAEQVAWHPPYFLLFDIRFIEVRHIETGRLVQIIPGNNIRCIWDGRGTTKSRSILEGPWDDVVSQEPSVFGVMNIESPQQDRERVRIERVFELIPTVPLYLPKWEMPLPLPPPPLPPTLPLPHLPPLWSPLLLPPGSPNLLLPSPKLGPHDIPSGGSRCPKIVTGEKARTTVGHPSPPIDLTTQENQEVPTDTCNDKTQTVTDTVPGSSIPVDPYTPAWKRLIGHTLPPREVISFIGTIFTNKDEIKMICDLRENNAQSFINVIHEVCPVLITLFTSFSICPSRPWISLISHRASGGNA